MSSMALPGAGGRIHSIGVPPAYLDHLRPEGISVTSASGEPVEIWALTVPQDEDVLHDWATRFRQSYCLDGELDEARDGTGLSRSEYLLQLVFPDGRAGLGPSVRAGDFAELLISDYVQYVLGYWVPRMKYADKTNPNESMQGVDVVGFACDDPSVPDPHDALLTFEVKARLSDSVDAGRLQAAIDGSGTDFARLAYTLNKAKQLLRNRNDADGVELVKRFQNKADRPYILRFGAGVVLSTVAYDADVIAAATTVDHPNRDALSLLVVRGDDLMSLVHSLYQRAADEA